MPIQNENEDNIFSYHPLHLQNMIVADYSVPLYRSDVVFVTNYPGKKEPVYSFLRVFDMRTWLLFAISLIVVTLAYVVTSKIVQVSLKVCFKVRQDKKGAQLLSS